MTSNFPTSNDSFSVPSSPSTTALSSAGDSTRNHWENHKALGESVVALEQNVPILTHDHSGTGPRATPKLKQVNTHEEPDTDNDTLSIHHTLGTDTGQAISLDIAKTQLDPRYVKLDNSNQTIDGTKIFVNSPVITQFGSMQHNHANSSQGGTIVVPANREESLPIASLFGPTATYVQKANSFSFTVPANIKLGGDVLVDFELDADLLQQVQFFAYLAPAFNSSGTTMPLGNYASSLSEGIWRNAGGTTTGDKNRINLSFPFVFASIGSVRVNYTIFVRMVLGSGPGNVKWNKMKTHVRLETSF